MGVFKRLLLFVTLVNLGCCQPDPTFVSATWLDSASLTNLDATSSNVISSVHSNVATLSTSFIDSTTATTLRLSSTIISDYSSAPITTASVAPTPFSSFTQDSSFLISSITPSAASIPHFVSSSLTPTSTPEPKVIIKCGKECENLKLRLKVATAFAIIFAIVAVTLGALFYRQRRIAKEDDKVGLI